MRVTAQTLENATEREKDRRQSLAFSAEHAWRTLEATRAAVDRADAKAAAMIAASGVTAAALFSLVGGHRSVNRWTVALLAACAVSALATAACAGMALRPRRHRMLMPTSLIYFDHVARMPGFSVEMYVHHARALFADPAALCDEISAQVWSVAKVSAVKYAWVDRSLFCLMTNLVTLGACSLVLCI